MCLEIMMEETGRFPFLEITVAKLNMSLGEGGDKGKVTLDPATK